MLDSYGGHGIVSGIEIIAMDRMDEAWHRMLRQVVRHRFVMDMVPTKSRTTVSRFAVSRRDGWQGIGEKSLGSRDWP